MALFGFGKKQTALSEEAVRAVLATLHDPELGQAFEGKRIHALEIKGGMVSVHLRLTYPAAGVREAVCREAEAALRALDGVQVVGGAEPGHRRHRLPGGAVSGIDAGVHGLSVDEHRARPAVAGVAALLDLEVAVLA